MGGELGWGLGPLLAEAGVFKPILRLPFPQRSIFETLIESVRGQVSAADAFYRSVRSELDEVLEVLVVRRDYKAQVSVVALTWVTAFLTTISLAVAAYQVFGVSGK
jgi:hypothetical protein